MSTFNNNGKEPKQSKKGERRNLVIIAGYYGFDNLGDEAILEELVNELSSFCAKQEIIVLSNNPEKTASTYQVKSINRWHWFDYFKLFRRAKLFVSGGGGLFQDRTGPNSVIFYSAQILLARLCGAKVLIYAQGLGPLCSVFGQTLTRIAFQQSNKITVRDSNSLALVKEWGLEAELTADPVWCLSPTALPASANETLKITKDGNPGKIIIGVSLRDDPKLQNYHLEFLVKGIANADKSTILLLPLQTQRDQKPLQVFEQFLSQYGITSHWLDPNILAKPSQWLTLIENMDFVVGMRFHALLMAIKTGRPVLGIAYDQKVSQLLNHFEQPSLSLGADKNKCQIEWAQTIEYALRTRDTLANIAQKKLIATKQLSDQNIKFLTEILEAGITNNVTSNHL